MSPCEEMGTAISLPQGSCEGQICSFFPPWWRPTARTLRLVAACLCPAIAGGRSSNTLCFGPTEKEKREKASQEGGDLLGGGLRDSTPSLKSREFWAGGGARIRLHDRVCLSPRGPQSLLGWGRPLASCFCFVVK